MNSRALITLIGIVVIVASAGWYFSRSSGDDSTTVAAVVLDFGSRLKNVSVLADRNTVAQSMQTEYGGLVTPTLITQWSTDPINAPGRKTSTPYPDRIEVHTVSRNVDGSYEVRGSVIDVAPVPESDGTSESSRQTITLRLEKIGGRWLITSLALGEPVQAPQWLATTTPQGIGFRYPASLGTSYISAQDWPPIMQLVNEEFTCTPGDVKDIDGLTIKREKHIVGDRAYCVDMHDEGAAGSIYRSYEYVELFDSGDMRAHIGFTLRFPQCLNYDDPQRAACMQEQSSFNIDELVDKIDSGITVR